MLPRMSDPPPAASVLDRVNTLSAPAVAGLGAAAGLLLAVLSALSVEPGSTGDASQVVAGSEPKPGAMHGEDGVRRAADGPDAEPAGAGHDSAADADADAGAEANGEADANADANADPDADPDAESNAGAETDAADEPEDVVLLDPDVGSPDDDAAPAAEDDPQASETAGAASQAPASPAGRSQADRDAEAMMDADELLAAAAVAYQEKRYKDAYRLATRSQRARPQDKAQMLRGRSACRLRDEKNAREIVRSFKLGDEHRKTLRTFCKDRGVRVGL